MAVVSKKKLPLHIIIYYCYTISQDNYTTYSVFMNLLLSVIVSIMSFGAVSGDESVNNAGAINCAIEKCAANGGGTVEVPNGEFTTGSIYLKSGVTLKLDDGAILKGSPRLSDYSPLHTDIDLSKFESGQGTVNYNSATDPQWSLAMIFAVDAKNTGIIGNGCIDGADVRNPFGEEHIRGPHTILLAGCSKVRFEGFSVKRSANYAILGYKLSKATFNRLCIKGGWDGIHIRGGKNVRISQCELHTGDDAIAGGYWENMSISHCTLNSSCNGIRMIMPSVDVEVSDCDIYGPGQFEHITSHRTSSEAGINLEPGAWGKAPGRMDRIRILRNRMNRVLTPLSVTLGDDNTLGKITIDNLTARGVTRMALSVKSWGKAITDCVVIRRCDLEFDGIDDPLLPAWFATHSTSEWPVFPCWGMYFRNVERVNVKDVTLFVKGKDYRTAFMCDNVRRNNIASGCRVNTAE